MQHELAAYRKYFPFLENGTIYFNHAAVSPLSTLVLEKIQEFQTMRSIGPIDDYKRVMRVTETVKQQVGALLGTTSDRIAFSDNTSNGLNILAQGLRLRPGDEIVLNDLEFPSNVYPFLNLARDGVVMVYAKSRDGRVTAEDIIACITPRTKVVSVSYVQFLTGYRVNLKTLSDYCRPRGIILAVDAIQGLGAVRLNVNETPVDFIASGCQKWMMADMGLSFVYVSKAVQEQLSPRYIGWLSVKNAWNLLDYHVDLRDDAAALQSGTTNVMGIFALGGALELFELTGQEARERVILSNTRYFIERLQEAGFAPLLAGLPDAELAGIVTFKPANAAELFERLGALKIVCSLREGYIRFAPHFYNTREEIDAVITVLQR
jgi:selenocysteine lyase/cysteine desulfurase